MLKGIDVAKYQGNIDFTLLKSAIDFIIIKASSGCPDPGETASMYADSKFKQNRNGAEREGIPAGFYHYAYPEVSGNTPRKEADCFCDNVGELKVGQFMVLDYESSWKGDVVSWCFDFLKRVEERTGIKPLIYLNQYTTNSYDWSRVINAGYGLWLAKWDYDANAPMPTKHPWPFAAFRQYSNRERVAGINADVDGNVYYGDKASLAKYGKQAAQNDPQPTPDPIVDPEPTPTPNTQEIDALKAEIAHLRELSDGVNKQIATAYEEKAKLKADYDEQAEIITSLQNEYRKVIEELAQSKKDSEAKESIIRNLQAKLQETTTDLSAALETLKSRLAKRAWQTTEGKLQIFSSVFGIVMASGLVPTGNMYVDLINQVVGVVLTMFGVNSLATTRTQVKTALANK